ncbi:hypothetical protein Chor_008136, partial [Crotalus horridus]
FSLGILSSHTGTAADCPSGWYTYEGHCYQIFHLFMTWKEAEQCSSKWSDGSSVSYENWSVAEFRTCLGLEQDTTDESLHLWYLHVLLQMSQEPPKRSSGTLRESLQEVIKFSLFYPDYHKWANIFCGQRNPFVCKAKDPAV